MEDSEGVFWYVIWEVQRLATEDHLDDGNAQQVLGEALTFLKEGQSLPVESIRRRS